MMRLPHLCKLWCNSQPSEAASALRALLAPLTSAQSPLQARQLSSLSASSLETLLGEEPLGAWRHDQWHQLPQNDIGAVGAYKILKRRLEEWGVQRELHLLAVLRRIKTPEQAALGLEAIALLRRHRANHQQHAPFNHYVGHCLMVRALETGAYDVVVEAHQRCHELGLGHMSGLRYSYVMSGLAKAEQLDALLKVYETMPRNGVRPSAETLYLIVKACKAAGRNDLAQAYAKEFEANGVRASEGNEH
ncbi:hypothetical protein WJX73_009496 [Symbiochloris irregularis]|uniref:Pentatricopeptide repeat-containing protein n=1 Tax=Symbiochloris irregularis TaxID=706552 RepID=A0AAW1NMN9_9CHLO